MIKCLLLLSLISWAMCSEVIPVPKDNWTISYSGSSPTQFNGKVDGDNYQYKSMSEDGIILSLFVEKQAASISSNGKVREFYWKQASQNPLIDEKSIKVSKIGEIEKVEYIVSADLKGELHKFKNTTT